MKINAYGFTTPNTGFGVAMRCHTEALRAFGDVELFNDDTIAQAKPADILYFHNFPQNIRKIRNLPIFQAPRKIAYWVWESSEIDESFKQNASFFDEIWTSSNYCAGIFSTIGKPVKVVPHFVSRYNQPFEPAGPFTFLYSFDGGSRYIRKNPFDLIDAYKKTFGKKNTDVRLILKIKNLGESIINYLKRICLDYNIYLMVADISYGDCMQLVEKCHCYVSPHRAEGFGLTILEAMALGRPVISTGYSGNLDFTDASNNFTLRVEEKVVDDNFYKGVWGYIDVEELGQVMKHVIENHTTRKSIAQKGFETALDWSMTKTMKETQKALG